MERVPENVDAAKELLQYGLKGTDLEALIAIGNREDGGRYGTYKHMSTHQCNPCTYIVYKLQLIFVSFSINLRLILPASFSLSIFTF